MSFEKKTLLHTVRRALSLRALLTIYIRKMCLRKFYVFTDKDVLYLFENIGLSVYYLTFTTRPFDARTRI